MPRHLCKKLDIRLWTYVRESYTLPFLLCLPLTAVLLLMQRFWFVPHKYPGLGLQLLIGVAVYGSGLLWFAWKNTALRVDESSLHGRSPGSVVVSPPAEAYQQDI